MMTSSHKDHTDSSNVTLYYIKLAYEWNNNNNNKQLESFAPLHYYHHFNILIKMVNRSLKKMNRQL